jgi:hypothetical protein
MLPYQQAMVYWVSSAVDAQDCALPCRQPIDHFLPWGLKSLSDIFVRAATVGGLHNILDDIPLLYSASGYDKETLQCCPDLLLVSNA